MNEKAKIALAVFIGAMLGTMAGQISTFLLYFFVSLFTRMSF